MGLKLLCVTKCENLQFRNLNVSLSCNSHFSNKVRMNVLYGQPMRKQRFIIRMAPEDEKMTKRSPLDFPQELERPSPGKRPDVFPQFSPLKPPLPKPMPADPPLEEEDEEEEEKKEEEEDPDKQDNPEE